MNKDIIKLWDKNNSKVLEWIKTVKNDIFSYELLLKNTLRIIIGQTGIDTYELPYHGRITHIDDGGYQGTLVFVIGGLVDIPTINDYWYTYVDYGSCSGSDTLLWIISGYDMSIYPSERQSKDYMALCLHMIQRMKKLAGDCDE